jgi:poly(3-hydroxyalkanoate) synthetase
MLEGAIAATAAVEKATGERSVNCVGYCLGGTLLASALAYLAAKGDDLVKSATYFVTLVDFVESGDMSVFIDSEQLAALEARMNEKGYLDAQDMATSLNMLRANDLIWSFVVGNYLLGKEPVPFDLLYWNSDATRMPAAMHSFYLRNMYQGTIWPSLEASLSTARQSIYGKLRHRHLFWVQRKITSHPGNQLIGQRNSMAVRLSLCCQHPATWPA